jgi:G:T-mismatch repair DNA endonuclease (very short patch repair protein)
MARENEVLEDVVHVEEHTRGWSAPRLKLFVGDAKYKSTVHGCPEHGTWPKQNAEWWRDKIEANRRRDADTGARLEDQGWCVIRVWEHDETEAAADAIARTVQERASDNLRRQRTSADARSVLGSLG